MRRRCAVVFLALVGSLCGEVITTGHRASAQACPPTTAVGGLSPSGLGVGVGGNCGGGASPANNSSGQPTVTPVGNSSAGARPTGGGSSGGTSEPQPLGNGLGPSGVGCRPTLLNPDLCDGPAAPASGSSGAVAAPVAAPPTRGEVWARVALPEPGCEYNPATTGLTGLASWGWAAPARTLTANPSINGYSVQAEARPVRFIWEWGDGASSSSTTPGSPTDPAVRHTYRTKADYTITCRVVWAGRYTFTSPGGSSRLWTSVLPR
jgi:hypothetical protein